MTENDRKALYDEGMEIRRRLEEIKSTGADGKAERDRLRRRYGEIDTLLRDDGVTQLADASATLIDESPVADATPTKLVAAEWNVGDAILDEYDVTGVLGEGGMGKVFKVHHRIWDMDMAVKSPRPKSFRTQAQKENFVRECHTWMDLGLHNHIVTCHYVRVLDDIPRLFAEYVEGGSLKDWIKNDKLYEGGPEKALKRILDIAIQFAWGLHYSHEKGLVHQDVKPDNVMMTPDGVAKVTDFGLSNARAVESDGEKPPEGQSILASYGGMTPAYCSPEQADNAARREAGTPLGELTKLTKRTDIYSWAVSVFEMFNGGITWQAGNVVEYVLESYLTDGAEQEDQLQMPESVVELLRKCLKQIPDDRPKDFEEIVTSLKKSYQATVGHDYPKEPPTASAELADVLNNKAVSFFELGQREKAEDLWKKALEIDPLNFRVKFNDLVERWRKGYLSDKQIESQLEESLASQRENWEDIYISGKFYLECGDSKKALDLLEKAKKHSGKNANAVHAIGNAISRLPRAADFYIEFPEFEWEPVLSMNENHLLTDGRGSLRLWSLNNGNIIRSFDGRRGSLSIDGGRVVIATLTEKITPDHQFKSSKQLKVLDIYTGECVTEFGEEIKEVDFVKLSPDGKWVLSVSNYRDDRGSQCWDAHLWNVVKGKRIRTLTEKVGEVEFIYINTDGSLAFFGLNENCRGSLNGAAIEIWDMKTGICIREVKEKGIDVSTIGISRDGRWMIVGSEIGFDIQMWDMTIGKCIRLLEGHTDSIRSVTVSPDGRLGMSKDHSDVVRLWDLDDGRCLRTYQTTEQRDNFDRHAGGLHSLLFRANVPWVGTGKRFRRIASLRDWAPILNKVSSWDARKSLEEKARSLFSNTALAIDSGDWKTGLNCVLAIQSIPGYARHPEAIAYKNKIGERCVRTGIRTSWRCKMFDEKYFKKWAFWSVKGQIVSLGDDNVLRMWNPATGECEFTQRLKANREHIFCPCLSLDQQELLTINESGIKTEIVSWDLKTGNSIKRIFTGSGARRVRTMCLIREDKMALTANSEGTLEIWHLATGNRLVSLEGHTREVLSLCISHGGRAALTISLDNTAKLWSLESGRCLRTLNESLMPGTGSLSLCANGKLALTANLTSTKNDSFMQLWNLTTGECLKRFSGRIQTASAAKISADGAWAISAGGHFSAFEVHDLRAGTHAHSFKSTKEDIVLNVGFSPDEKWILMSGEKTVQLWELDWEYEARDPVDWDEGARPYLVNFLTLQTPYAVALSANSAPTEKEVTRSFKRKGKAEWSDEEFSKLIDTLGHVGYGWLRPEGVRKELEKMTEAWTGPPPLFGTGTKGKTAGLLKGLFGKKK
jgi:WD40 repeat protein/tRNA A-37 threonylcarbamoyl transferase component Bud32